MNIERGFQKFFYRYVLLYRVEDSGRLVSNYLELRWMGTSGVNETASFRNSRACCSIHRQRPSFIRVIVSGVNEKLFNYISQPSITQAKNYLRYPAAITSFLYIYKKYYELAAGYDYVGWSIISDVSGYPI